MQSSFPRKLRDTLNEYIMLLLLLVLGQVDDEVDAAAEDDEDVRELRQ